MLNQNIRGKIDQLWDKFWSGGIANPLTAVEQISYLLFMRRLDAMDRKKQEDAEYLKRPYKSIFEKDEQRWSHFRNLPAEEMLTHVRDKVFPFIKSLGKEGQSFSKYMQDAVFIIPKASLLVEAVGVIDEIYTEIERETKESGQTFHDTQGDLYEYLLSEIATAGKNGQFRTPRHIIQMMCALVDPKLGEEICDPACGTGGFLLGAFQHILTRHTSPKLRHKDENGMERGLVGDKLTDKRQWQVLKEKTFHGYDFDTTMVRIGLMNLILHGIENPDLRYMDALSKSFADRDRFDVVLANPPFTGSIDKGDINEDLSLKTTKTELLFVNRIINMLRIGGRAAIIVPEGVLFNSSNAHKSLRELLLDKCDLQAVVKLPPGVFSPYSSVSTAIIVFVKGGVTERVWFYDIQADGRSLDDKRQKVDENDIPDVIARWGNRDHNKDTNREGKAFFVPVTEIRENKCDLSINRYKTVVYEQVKYDPPNVIMNRLRDLEKEIMTDLDELERALK